MRRTVRAVRRLSNRAQTSIGRFRGPALFYRMRPPSLAIQRRWLLKSQKDTNSKEPEASFGLSLIYKKLRETYPHRKVAKMRELASRCQQKKLLSYQTEQQERKRSDYGKNYHHQQRRFYSNNPPPKANVYNKNSEDDSGDWFDQVMIIYLAIVLGRAIAELLIDRSTYDNELDNPTRKEILQQISAAEQNIEEGYTHAAQKQIDSAFINLMKLLEQTLQQKHEKNSWVVKMYRMLKQWRVLTEKELLSKSDSLINEVFEVADKAFLYRLNQYERKVTKSKEKLIDNLNQTSSMIALEIIFDERLSLFTAKEIDLRIEHLANEDFSRELYRYSNRIDSRYFLSFDTPSRHWKKLTKIVNELADYIVVRYRLSDSDEERKELLEKYRDVCRKYTNAVEWSVEVMLENNRQCIHLKRQRLGELCRIIKSDFKNSFVGNTTVENSSKYKLLMTKYIELEGLKPVARESNYKDYEQQQQLIEGQRLRP